MSTAGPATIRAAIILPLILFFALSPLLGRFSFRDMGQPESGYPYAWATNGQTTTAQGAGTKQEPKGCSFYEAVANPAACIILGLVILVSNFVTFVPHVISSALFDWSVEKNIITDDTNNKEIAKTAFVTTGWKITSGVANMFFVLILLWIAIATIFDFEPYTARSLLPKLIIMALLINFSLPIGGFFINLSNALAREFYKKGEEWVKTGSGVSGVLNTASAIAALVGQSPKASGTQGTTVTTQCVQTGAGGLGLGEADCVMTKWSKGQDVDVDTIRGAILSELMKIPFILVLSFVYFAGAIFLLIRYLSLSLILVFAPLAFLFFILPATRGYWTTWWKKLLEQSFFAPAFMFLLFLVINYYPILFSAQPGDWKDPTKYAPTTIAANMIMLIVLLIMSLLVAKQMGVYGANTVTGWGEKMGKGVGKYVGARGWKYGGKGVDKFMESGIGTALSRIPVLGAGVRAAATAVMKKGVGVEKKDMEFYSKLPDRQLATVLSTMSEARAKAIWGSLPPQRKRGAAGNELGALARSRPDWKDVPPAPAPPPPPLTPAPPPPSLTPAQELQQTNQAIQNQVMPIIQGLTQFQQLPQNLQNAIVEGVERAIQNLPAGVQPQAASQAIQQAVQNTVNAQPPGAALVAQPAANAIQGQAASIQTAVAQAQGERAQAILRARQLAARPQITPSREELMERMDYLEEEGERAQAILRARQLAARPQITPSREELMERMTYLEEELEKKEEKKE